MENLLLKISEKLNLPIALLKNDLVLDNLVDETFVNEEMKSYFDEKLFSINEGKTYLYILKNISKRNASTLVFELLKAVLDIKSKYHTVDIHFILIEDDNILDFELLLKSLPVSLEKYSPDFDYILSEFSESTDEVLKKNIKLKIFSEVIKYIYKDEELKDLLLLLVKNKF